METRKIQKTGISTYIVSLPKSWIIKKGLKAGDKINIIEEKDQNLRLCLDYKDPFKKEVSIKLSKETSFDELIRKLTAYYLNGATKIEIETDSRNNMLHEITINLKRFMGFEIIEHQDNKIIAQDFFTSENLSLIKTLKRIFSISKLVIQETKRLIETNFIKETNNNKEANILDNIKLWEEEVDKLYLLIRRQINFAIHNSYILRTFEITLKESQDHLLLVDAIEKITDSFFTISECIQKIDKLSDKSIKRLSLVFDKILTSYEIAFSSIFEKDFKKSNNNYEKIKEILDYNLSIHEENINEKSKENLYRVLANIHTITSYLEEIAEIGLGVEEENNNF